MTPEIRRLLDDWKALVARIHATLPEDGSSIYFENGKAWAYQQCIEQLEAALLALPVDRPTTAAGEDAELIATIVYNKDSQQIEHRGPADRPPPEAQKEPDA
jgi:hypothetical protein